MLYLNYKGREKRFARMEDWKYFDGFNISMLTKHDKICIPAILAIPLQAA